MIALLTLLLAGCSSEYTIVLDQPTLQAKVDEKFPLRQGNPALVMVEASNPVVSLPGTDRLGLGLQVTARWLDPAATTPAPPAPSPDAEAEEAEADELDALWRVGEAVLRAAAGPQRTAAGTLEASGRLEYRAESGALYLRDVEIGHLEMDGLHPAYAEVARGLGEAAVRTALETWPVHTLEGEAQERAARLVLKEVRAAPDGLHVTLGW